MHKLIDDFRLQALAIRRRRVRRRAARVAVAGSLLASLTFAAVAVQHPLLRDRIGFGETTQQTIALPETLEQKSAGDFALQSTDAMRDPVFLYPASGPGAPSNKYEIRFQTAASATDIKGAVYYVSDRMMSSSVQLMTALPATPRDFALMGSSTVDERAAPALPGDGDLTPVAGQPENSADGGAGWELIGQPDNGNTLPPVAPSASAAQDLPAQAGTSTLDVIRPQLRSESAREYVVKVLFERSVESVLLESGLSQMQVTEAAQAAARLLNLPILQPGYIAAFRVDGSRAGPQIVQLSLVSEHGVAGSIGLRTDGTYASIADPWAGQGLQAYAKEGSTNSDRQRFRLMDGLYSAGVRNGIPPHVISEVIMQMARNYNLSQFIQANDRFTVIYSDVPRDPGRASGHILYANVRSSGETLACYVLKPGRDDDFTCMTEKDTVTQRLGPVGFVMPVNGALRSGFGPRMHPILKQVRMHQGVDWAAPPGTPVVAAFDGTVVFAGENGGYGNFVRIAHPNGLESGYAHLSGFAKGLKEGTKIKAKDIIGYVGSTGLSTGPHLHFELYTEGQAVDPFSVETQVVQADGTEKDKLVGRIIRVESGGNANAQNPLSSATGLGQFLSGTWLRMMRSYRPDLYRELGDGALLSLRTDPSLAREMVYNLAAENEADIRRAGFQATAGNLYLAHFLGSQGAIDVLRVPSETPLIDVVGGSVIAANPFLYDRDAGWVIDWAARKMTGQGAAMTIVKRLPPEVRIRNSRFLAYSTAIDKLLESIESKKPNS